MSKNVLIQLQGIRKVFYTDEVETHALEDVDLQINEGEYVSIAGPSGSGKTTLLSILGLLDSPTGGEYMLDGEPVATFRRRIAREFAIGRSVSSFRRSISLAI